MFLGCTKLKKVIMPKNLKYIGSSAFKDCKSLTNITIPNGITRIGSIGMLAFSGCSSLTTVEIPNSITDI